MSDQNEYMQGYRRTERYPSFYGSIESYEDDDNMDTNHESVRVQSITPNEWEDFKKLTKQESTRPSEIEEPETPLEQSERQFTFDEEYSRHFGKPFGMPETDDDKEQELARDDGSEEGSVSPVPQYADYRKYSEDGSVGYEENEYRIEGDIGSDTDSDSSVDSARYNGTAYSQKFGRQYSNHEELFTPPPNAVPEFPSFPTEDDLADFTAANEIEPGNIIDDEVEDTIERRQNAVINMALRKEDGALLDWINQFTSRDVHNFGDDFEDPNIWISLMHGLLSQLGDYDSPNIRTGDYDAAYEYCNWAMNELGIDERNELNILMTADDLFGGHAMLNQTVVSLINAAFKMKLDNYEADPSPASSSDDESMSEGAIYDSPDSTDVTEENVDYEDNRGPRPDTPEPEQPVQTDQKAASLVVSPVAPCSSSQSNVSPSLLCLAISLFFVLSK